MQKSVAQLLTPKIQLCKDNLETNDISFESPNIELSELEMKMGVASSGGFSHSIKCD